MKFVKERFAQNVGNQAFIGAYPLFDEIFENPNRNYIFNNDAINCERFNNNGDGIEIFVGNRVRTVEESDADAASFLTDSKALRRWLEKVGDRSLKEIGLKENWGDVESPVSPNYSTER